MLEKLKEEVFAAHMELSARGLVVFTWGNVSGIDRRSGLVAIKPSGVGYDDMKVSDIVLVDLNGRAVEGEMRPSADTPAHLELYKGFPAVGAVVHTHSRWAMAFAQAGREIPPYGTPHADYFYGPIPCTREITDAEIRGEGDCEKTIGRLIVERFLGVRAKVDPIDVPAALVRHVGPFAWGKDPREALRNAAVLEEIAMTAWHTQALSPAATPMPRTLLDRHYLRRHGVDAYYGQNPGEEL
ncbi:MAG: L-ribulose-5-phosphate 4-epimerase AraD [Synergistaceae bacterium]|jgi:L-ribulose-5-phosphate 4-epimerase|nr:L-ribulose-5-phosphate 4-epimerase AraD [Synergistaceae bacterium]